MKTSLQKIVEGRFFIPVLAILYAALAGVLFGVMGIRGKGAIEIMLTQIVSKVLWINFLVILIAVLLCGRDIAEAFRALFSAVPCRPGLHPNAVSDPPALRLGRLNRPGIWLCVILVGGLLLVSQVAPQVHRVYFDEDIYANMAQNMAFTGQTGMANYGSFEYGEYFVHWLGYNKDPSGWPFLISLAFQLFGTDETLAFWLNNLLFAGGILIVFFIARHLAKSTFSGLIAALVFAVIPHNVIWSNTAAAEPSAAFFAGLVVLCTLVYLQTRAARHLFLLAAVLPFACYMRPESPLIALWTFAAVSFNLLSGPSDSRAPVRHPFATRTLWAAGLITLAFIIPIAWHLFVMSGQSWGAPGPKFSTSFLLNHLTVNGLYFLNNRAFPVLFTLLALVGLAAWKRRPSQAGRPIAPLGVLLILLWFLLFWGIFLFFYAGSYQYGADVRFALVCFMPFSVLAGLGGDALMEWVGRREGAPTVHGETAVKVVKETAEEEKGSPAPSATSSHWKMEPGACGPNPGTDCRRPFTSLLILLLFICWLKFVPQIRLVGQEAWGARYDHKYAHEFIQKIPNRSIVVTHIPTMFLLWGQNAIQSYAGINNPDLIRDLMMRYNGHVYFHKNYWCNALNDANQIICNGMSERYNLEPVAVAREQSYEYGLYRMTFK